MALASGLGRGPRPSALGLKALITAPQKAAGGAHEPRRRGHFGKGQMPAGGDVRLLGLRRSSSCSRDCDDG